MTNQKEGKQANLKEVLWVQYVCSNTLCTSSASPRPDKRNFESVPFYGVTTIPNTITCTACGSAMNKE